MEYIRKKINLENFTVRNIPKSVLKVDSSGKTIIDTSNPNYYYGTIPDYRIDDEGNFILDSSGKKIENTISIDIFLTQKLDDMGIFTDKPFVPKNNTLTSKPSEFNSFTYGRLAGAPVNFYYTPNNAISGYTDDSQLEMVKSYRKNSTGGDIYVPFLNTSNDTKNIFNGVISDNSNKTIYKIGANVNNISNTGIEYTTYKNSFIKKINDLGKSESYRETTFYSPIGGWNQYNTSLSASTKKEEFLGVVFKPEVENVVFINRGVGDIFERHSILSEIKSTNDIDTNRGGYIRN